MKKGLLLAAAFLLFVASCLAANVVVVEELIAKVNGDIITRSDYEQSLSEATASIRAQNEMNEAERERPSE